MISLLADYSNSITLSNVGELSWSWIPKKHIKVQKEFVYACLRPPKNVKLGIFRACLHGVGDPGLVG